MSRKAAIDILVRDKFSTGISRQSIRDGWTRLRSIAAPTINRINFGPYTPSIFQGTLGVQFASNNDGTGTVTGYSVIIDADHRVTFLTPAIGAEQLIYARYGDGNQWSNWFELLVTNPRIVIPRFTVRSAWGILQSINIPSTNRFDFSDYTPEPEGTLEVQFALNDDGTGEVTGYSARIDAQKRVTFLTPIVSQNRLVYARYGNGLDWSNWFELVVNDAAVSIPTQTIRDSWDLADSRGERSTNRIDFSPYTPSPTLGYLRVQFAANRDGTGTVIGYSARIDSSNRVTFLTPTVITDHRVYARYGDGISWSNWFAIIVEKYAPSAPVTIVILYGSTDTLGAPVGTAGRLSLTGTLTGSFITPTSTSDRPYWYFEIPTGYELVSIKNKTLGLNTDDPNWARIGDTGRYLNHSPIVGFTGNFEITVRSV